MTSRTLHLLLALSIWPLLLIACAGQKSHEDDAVEVAKTTLVHVGDLAPEFSVATLAGGTFTLAEQRGKIVLINWWATWCPPCRQEIPHLETEVWQKFQGEEFAMISISREETPEEVQAFLAKNTMSWPQAVDGDRTIYGLFAESYIPRNFVVDREGKVIFESQGYTPEEFSEMVDVIAAALSPSGDSH